VSRGARGYLGALTLSDDQARGLHTRLDKIIEAMAAERFVVANAAINELYSYLKSIRCTEHVLRSA
jgi:predicted transcriptional regulator